MLGRLQLRVFLDRANAKARALKFYDRNIVIRIRFHQYGYNMSLGKYFGDGT